MVNIFFIKCLIFINGFKQIISKRISPWKDILIFLFIEIVIIKKLIKFIIKNINEKYSFMNVTIIIQS